MTTTFIPFQPNPASGPFTFQATLDDGAQYLIQVTWSLFGRRWYITVSPIQGSPIVVNYPMVGSPDDYNINLLAAWFTTPMVFRQSTGQFEINPATPPGTTGQDFPLPIPPS